MRKTYTGMITKLEPNQIFVFGSNTQGIHGAGAARFACNNFGAIYGQAEGIQGQSYGLITTDLTAKIFSNSLPITVIPFKVIVNIKTLYSLARRNRDKEFLIAYSATGVLLSGYTNKQMAKMFRDASKIIPKNIVFEEGFNDLVFNQ